MTREKLGSECQSVSFQVNKTLNRLWLQDYSQKLLHLNIMLQMTAGRKKQKSKKPSRLIIGNFNASLTKLSAAKPVLHIFPVDNAAEGCPPGDVIDHLKSMEIPVISCFECKSWRKLGPEEIMCGKGQGVNPRG